MSLGQLRKRREAVAVAPAPAPQAGMLGKVISVGHTRSPGYPLCPFLVDNVSRSFGRGQKKQEKGIKKIKTACLMAVPGFLSVIRE